MVLITSYIFFKLYYKLQIRNKNTNYLVDKYYLTKTIELFPVYFKLGKSKNLLFRYDQTCELPFTLLEINHKLIKCYFF